MLEREDFDVEKPAQLADLLRRVAGVHVDQVGGRGGTGSLYLRGADPNYTLVLVDGVRVNDPTNARGGSFDFSTLRRRGCASAWRSRAARIRPCTAAMRSPASSTSSRATRRASNPGLRSMPWAARYDTREISR